MTNKLRYLNVVFDNTLSPFELPDFRKAVSYKVGYDKMLFHNHMNEGFRYSYPLIQYKIVQKHPSIICLEEGIEGMQHFLEKSDRSIVIKDRILDLSIHKLIINTYNMAVWNKLFDYRISNWIAFNQTNFQRFSELNSDFDHKTLLEKNLIGNILTFAKGINWYIDEKIVVNILKIEKIKTLKFKNLHFKGFDLQFQTNTFLPDYIGLGGKVSQGYGKISRLKIDHIYNNNV